MANIFETIQKNDMLKVLLILLGVYLFITYLKPEEKKEKYGGYYYGSIPEQLENEEVQALFSDELEARKQEQARVQAQMQAQMQAQNAETPVAPQPTVFLGGPGVGADAPVASAEQNQIDKIVAGETQLKAEDLLPKYDDANAFAKENPVTNLLKEQNFLISGYHVGINTVLQSNKIPYLDIRSLPPIPKESVGPWNQSSYEQSPGQLRRGVEIL
jgi:hypothetical protein